MNWNFEEMTLASTATTVAEQMSFLEFAKQAKAAGFTEIIEFLKPAEGKFPVIVFRTKAGDRSIIVALSKGVGKLLNEHQITRKDLYAMSVVKGQNAAGEQRFYLSRNGSAFVTTVDNVVSTMAAIKAEYGKLSPELLAAAL